MHIRGELADAAARELQARRASLASELARVAARSTLSGARAQPAVTPAEDEVHISTEARAANWARQAGIPDVLRPFPSPTELIAALTAALNAPGETAPAEVARLARVLGELASGLPGAAPSLSAVTPATALADAIVRVLLGTPAGAPPDARALRTALELVRELVTAPAAPIAPEARRPALMERAAAAIVLAVLRWRGSGVALPHAADGGPAAELPAALLSLVDPSVTALPRKRRRRSALQDDPATDEADAEQDGPPPGYRSNPRLK